LNPKLARRILSELVSLPSVHPDAFPGGTKPGEALAGAWMASHLAKLGADVETRQLSPGRPNVVAVFDTVGKARKTVLFAPHLDTVGVLGMTVPPFRLTAKAGRLHGRGACDTKGPTAALLAALDHWSRSKERSRTDVRWVVAATAGEEQGSLGAEFLCKRGLKADFAIALEPTNLRVVTGAKGVLRVKITLTGRAAHGSAPQRGVNAVYGMVPLISEIRGNLSRLLASSEHPVLGRATVNLGSIAGGGELNIVPERCTIGLDIRTHPACTGASVLKMLRAAIRSLARTATMEVVCNRPAFVTDREGEWSRRVRRAAKGWATADWFCDANVFNSHGIPAVAFGPGRIDQAHTKDEFILERDLNMGARSFLGILLGSPHGRL
jgi:acetylornithine deacetylase/succinyl-diaminopimelate desuccinylase-like protein